MNRIKQIYSEILKEANVNSLATVFQNDYLRIKGDLGKKYNELPDEKKKALRNYIESRKKHIEKLVNGITNNPHYQSWIYDMLKTGKLIFPEDEEKTKDVIKKFDRYKRSANFTSSKNILDYKSFGDLYKAIKEFEPDVSSRISLEYGNNKVVFEKGNYVILELNNFDECSFLLKDTGWCVQRQEYFENYKPPYYLMLKDGKKFALMHFPSGQLKDIHDNSFEKMETEDANFIMDFIISKDISIENIIDFVVVFTCTSKEVPERFLQAIAKESESSYRFSEYLIDNNKEVPERFLQAIAKESYSSYNFATYLIRNNKEVPELILQAIAKDSEWSYRFSEYLIDNNKEVPELILQGIAKDSGWSYHFAKDLIMNNKEVPELILQAIAKESYSSYNFAEYLIMNNKEVPELILQGIAKESESSYRFSEYLIDNNKEVPEIILRAQKLFEKLYSNLILEKLIESKFDINDIAKKLVQSYKNYNKLNKSLLKPRKNEETQIEPIIKKIVSMYYSYYSSFLSENEKTLKQTVVNEDIKWTSFFNNIAQQYFRQATKLVFLDLLKQIGLNIPIYNNEFGHPVYKFHLINKYIQLEVLKDLKQENKITPERQRLLETIVFTDRIKVQFKNEIENYINTTKLT